jgi:hypothetical protein
MAYYDSYSGYDGEDEETRRRRREDEAPSAYQPPSTEGRGPGTIFDPDYRDDGMGTPESGYGPGGVDNPAYNGPAAPTQPDNWPGLKQTGDDVFRGNLTQPVPTPPSAPPSAPNTQTQQPTFLPAASAAPVPAPITQPVQQPPITSQLTKILQDRLNALSQSFDPNQDDAYKKTIAAYELGQERDARRQRRVAAERAAAGGYGSSGALNTKIQGINEKRGQQGSMFAAQTAADRIRERDQQLTVAIQLARAVGQDDLAGQLEQQKLKLSEMLGTQDLALRKMLGLGQLQLGFDRLGFDYTSLADSSNRAAILAALGG